MAAERVIYQLYYFFMVLPVFAKMPRGGNGEDIGPEKGTVIRYEKFEISGVGRTGTWYNNTQSKREFRPAIIRSIPVIQK